MYMKKGDKMSTEIRQIILETETKDDVIDITLEMIDLQVPILYEPRYTEFDMRVALCVMNICK